MPVGLFATKDEVNALAAREDANNKIATFEILEILDFEGKMAHFHLRSA